MLLAPKKNNENAKNKGDFKELKEKISFNSDLNSSNAKILYYHNCPEDIWNIPRISEYMYVVGPYLNDNEYPYVKAKLKLPHGDHDLSTVIEQLGGISLDILISYFDTHGHSLKNVGIFKGIRVVLIGDVHHLHKPVEKAIDYLIHENFDLCFLGDIRIAPYLRNLTKAKLVFAGQLLTCGTSLSPSLQHIKRIIHVGQANQFHIKRGHFLSDFKSLKLPLDNIQSHPQQVPNLYNQYAAVLNISLNAEWNYRWLQVMESGGVLVSNKLSKSTGLPRIYSDEEVLTFSSVSEGLQKFDKILNDDDFRYETAVKAQKKYREIFDRKITLERFWDAINGRNFEAIFDLNSDYFDKKYYHSENSFYWKNIKLFQIVQECIRTSKSLSIDLCGWTGEDFPILDSLEIQRINRVKRHDRLDHSNSDCKILITNKTMSANINNYDLIVSENKKVILNNYKLIDSDQYFDCFKRKEEICFSKDIFPVHQDLVCNGESTNLKYELSFIKNFFSKNAEYKEKKSLLIAGLNEDKSIFKEQLNFSKTISFSEFQKQFCLLNKSEFYDIIIFIDNSNSPSQLHENLQKIYNSMHLNSVLLFHSARFTLGPFGWIDSYPLYDEDNINQLDPWEHYLRTDTNWVKTYNVEHFYEKIIDVVKKEFGVIPRNIAYNATFILKSFLLSGFKVIDKIELINRNNPPLKSIEMMNYQVNPKISHLVICAEKASWLDGSKENLNYFFN